MLLPNSPNHQQISHFVAPSGLAQALWLQSMVSAHRLIVVIADSQARLNELDDELRFFGIIAHIFNDYETLVYDQLSVAPEIISSRIELLTHMPSSGVLLVSVQTLMARVSPPSYLLGRYFDVQVGARFDVIAERERLTKAGYTAVDNVYGAGEFAIRGSIIDIFAIGQTLPFRIELFDDEIESIKFFNPDTQRTVTDDELATLKKSGGQYPDSSRVTQFSLLPAREFDLADTQRFRHNFASIFPQISARKVDFYNDIINGIAPSGVEYYTPLFFDLDEWHKHGTLFDYLPTDVLIVCDDALTRHYDEYWTQIYARYNDRAYDVELPILAPELLFLPANEFFAYLKNYPRVVMGSTATEAVPLFAHANISAAPNLPINHQNAEPLGEFINFVHTSSTPVLLCAESTGRREIILELLKTKMDVALVADFAEFIRHLDKYKNTLALSVAPIEQGLVYQATTGSFSIITEAQIFGRTISHGSRTKSSKTMSQAFLVKSVSEMSEGSLVVHLEHGIGRYQGLMVMDMGDGAQEFIHIKYADDASVYVPITHLSLVGRYSGVDSVAVELSKIGSGKWDRARQKALTQIYDVAAELLNIQARRNAKLGISFDVDMASYELFASEFDYEETADQQLAIASVIHDMKQNKPMDRLICGDVGFGKTEVAMRAAFIAVQAGYQVAVLVPTTLLARQHEDSFRSRFADWAVTIESLSRFGTKKHHDKVLADVTAGKVDIVIGTHRLLQHDVKFKNLGLMIVDEEHRFGVRHKEKIKAIQSDIDSLSMTATPIPRTLNMALSGMQDISIIATPPARRLPIKTFIAQKSNTTTKDAILREILRGGQVYYLHNDVASINSAAESLVELIPEVRVGVAHGQMAENELSAVMSDFYHKKTNVLVASTIIETGIDVPNANTIIINRADKFGLAQLHQLRGRVGRSHHQAYCYLFVPSFKGLSSDAKKRLDAISRANTLGAGFMLASEDLEIRGAGEILGKEQSGNMQTIGFGLYMDMLARATRAIKAGATPSLATPLDIVSDINIHASALINDDYLPDVHERLLMYKRIAAADTIDELNELKTEMIDRFGSLPTVTTQLFVIHRLRVLAKPIAISKIDVTSTTLTLEFKPDTPVDGMALITLIQSDDGYRMNGATGLKYRFKKEKNVEERTYEVEKLLRYFGEHIIVN